MAGAADGGGAGENIVNWFRSAIRELFSLFVDDIYFALALVAWIAIGTLGLPYLGLAQGWNGPLLFIGFVTIFVVSVWNAARE